MKQQTEWIHCPMCGNKTRVRIREDTVLNTFTKMLYLLCAFSIVVPFQMVMFTLSLVADRTGLNTPWGNFHRYPVHERQLWTRRYGSCHGGFDPGRYSGYYILFVLSEIHHRRCGCRSSKRIR